ncbi:MAG TPA: glycosyltransferase family 9 protein [Luteibaculaceae bacterium]|nr:glycosyltransferase family 9 protein [Luteibaculaceae bacterium]
MLQPTKILVVQTAFIGDVVLATALVESIVDRWPDCTVDFMVRKGNESLLTNHPYLRKVLVLTKKTNKWGNLWRMIQTVRNEQYDIVINVQRFFATGLITALSGAKTTVGFRKNPWSFLFSHRVDHDFGTRGLHEVDRNLKLLEPLFKAKLLKPVLYPSDADANAVRRETPYAVLAPSSVWFTKQWPEKRWVELTQVIPDSIEIVLIGGPADRELCGRIQAQSKRQGIINRAGELTFLQSAALMKGALINVVNDSGPLHFASAVNAPVCAIFCSTIPEFGFGPLSKKSVIVQNDQPLSCRPCGNHGFRSCPKGHFQCADISAQTVWRKAAALIS